MREPDPRPPGLARLSAFLRSLTIQGSWNYRSMIGSGFAFTLLPLLRRPATPQETRALESLLARHSTHFNAHPYLVGVALGAVARLERDGASPEVVGRFKAAVRGPLGALGDGLVWTGWLPMTLLLGLVAAWGGVPPLLSVSLFLVLYNAGHLGLRAWAFEIGFTEGHGVGHRLKEASLDHRTELLVRAGVLLLGLLCGLVLVTERGLGGSDRVWTLLAAGAFLLGLLGGVRVWRPTALAVTCVIVGVLISGLLP